MTEGSSPSSADSSGASSDEFKFRVVLLGEAAVGKTSLIRRFTENSFDEDYKQTIGTTFASKDVSVTDDEGQTRQVRLIVWDMGGQTTYRELRRQFMKGSSGAIIAYDVTRPETFMAMNNWFESFRETCPNAAVVIAANKVDLLDSRIVPVEPGLMLRDWFQADYYETSAKTGAAVTDVFDKLAKLVLRQVRAEKKSPEM